MEDLRRLDMAPQAGPGIPPVEAAMVVDQEVVAPAVEVALVDRAEAAEVLEAPVEAVMVVDQEGVAPAVEVALVDPAETAVAVDQGS